MKMFKGIITKRRENHIMKEKSMDIITHRRDVITDQPNVPNYTSIQSSFPLQSPIGFWAKFKQKIASIFGYSNKPNHQRNQHRGRGYHHGGRPRHGGHGQPRHGGRPNFRRQGPRQG
jgi:hypothetical protein